MSGIKFIKKKLYLFILLNCYYPIIVTHVAALAAAADKAVSEIEPLLKTEYE